MERNNKKIIEALDGMVKEGKARLLYDERESAVPGKVTRRIYKYDETLIFYAENLTDGVVSGTTEMSHAETVGYRYSIFSPAEMKVFPGNCSIELCAVLDSRDDTRLYVAMPVVKEYNATPLGFESSDIPFLDVVRGEDTEHYEVIGSGSLLLYSNNGDNVFTADGVRVTPERIDGALWRVGIKGDGRHKFVISK